MDHYQQSHETLTSGVKKKFEDLERNYPEPEHQGALANLRAKVHNFCTSEVPTNDDELMKLTKSKMDVMTAIHGVDSVLHRMKLWAKK